MRVNWATRVICTLAVGALLLTVTSSPASADVADWTFDCNPNASILEKIGMFLFGIVAIVGSPVIAVWLLWAIGSAVSNGSIKLKLSDLEDFTDLVPALFELTFGVMAVGGGAIACAVGMGAGASSVSCSLGYQPASTYQTPVVAEGERPAERGTPPSDYAGPQPPAPSPTEWSENREAPPRYGNTYCYRMIQEAQNTYRRDWERWLPEDVRIGCRAQIERERRRSLPDQYRSPQEFKRPPPTTPRYERGQEPTEVGVRYDDLDLSTEEGARTFLSRLRQAASRACGGRPDAREIKEMQRFRKCVADEMDRVVALLNQPTVTAVYQRER